MVSKWVTVPHTPFISTFITHLLTIDPKFLGHPSSPMDPSCSTRSSCLMQARQDQDVIQLRHQGQVIPDGTRMMGGNVWQQNWIIQIKHTL